MEDGGEADGDDPAMLLQNSCPPATSVSSGNAPAFLYYRESNFPAAIKIVNFRYNNIEGRERLARPDPAFGYERANFFHRLNFFAASAGYLFKWKICLPVSRQGFSQGDQFSSLSVNLTMRLL